MNQNALLDLTLELRSADGTSTEFYQADQECIQKTLRLLGTPRLLSQPLLVLASIYGVSAVPCPKIDMILARTSAQMPIVFPQIFPVGLLDLVETDKDSPDTEISWNENDGDPEFSGPLASRVEIHTLGNWVVTLKALAVTRDTVHDQLNYHARLFDLPIIPFRLPEGGIGLINPANITRVTLYPAPDALPESALPMELLRWTPPQLRIMEGLASAAEI